MRFDLIKYCEIDKYAQKSYDAIHGTTQEDNLVDVMLADFKNLPQSDMIVGGSPCFVAGTKVLTGKGYKNIEDILVGDIVLTHKNRFKNVLRVGGEYDKEIYNLKAQGFLNIFATENHPFYVKKDKFHEPEKMKLKDIKKGFYLGSHINVQESNIYNLTNETCWILGRYVADGHIRHNKRKHRKNSYQYGVILSVGEDKIEEVKNSIKNIHYSCYKHTQSTYRVVISSMELVKFILDNNFGTSAAEKSIPNFILDLPKDKLKNFLDGYMSGDGCYIEKLDLYSATTISEKLALSLCIAIQKVYSTGCRIYKNKRPKTTVIQGRIVNQSEDYTIRFSKNKNKKYSWFIEENIVWYPVKSIEKTSKIENVFNIEVEEDHTYTANNAITYNCQDFSVAGKGKGSLWTCKDCGHEYNPIHQHYTKRDKCPNCESKNLDKTRSSLLVEYLRAVRENKPKFFIYENVKNIIGKGHKETFDLFVKELEEYGYAPHYKIMNGKDYGIPQNRERIFVIGIREDIHNGFEFPKPFDNGIRLKDMLEQDVDERYYISDEKCANLVSQIKNKDTSVPNLLGGVGEINFGKQYRQGNRIYDGESVAMCLLSQPVGNAGGNSYLYAVPCLTPDRVEKRQNGRRFKEDSATVFLKANHRIRKLTPKECWRLMGFKDEQFQRVVDAGVSNSQLYKQAGNSIITKCLYHIYLQLQKYYPNDFKDGLSLISLFSGIGAFEVAFEFCD